jgi:hypothetical protein
MRPACRYGAAALAVVAAGLVFALLSVPVPLTGYEAAGEGEVVFLHDGREVFPVSVVREPLPDPDQTRLAVVLGDRAGIRIESVAITIRGPVGVYLGDCGVGLPPVRFQHVAGGGYGSILVIPDTGIMGNGAMTIPFLLVSRGTENLTIDIEARLSEMGFPWRRYEARHRFEV